MTDELGQQQDARWGRGHVMRDDVTLCPHGQERRTGDQEQKCSTTTAVNYSCGYRPDVPFCGTAHRNLHFVLQLSCSTISLFMNLEVRTEKWIHNHKNTTRLFPQTFSLRLRSTVIGCNGACTSCHKWVSSNGHMSFFNGKSNARETISPLGKHDTGTKAEC